MTKLRIVLFDVHTVRYKWHYTRGVGWSELKLSARAFFFCYATTFLLLAASREKETARDRSSRIKARPSSSRLNGSEWRCAAPKTLAILLLLQTIKQNTPRKWCPAPHQVTESQRRVFLQTSSLSLSTTMVQAAWHFPLCTLSVCVWEQ